MEFEEIRRVRRVLVQRSKDDVSDSPAIRGEEGTRNCYVIKRNVPFITEGIRTNSHCLYGLGREVKVWCVTHSAARRGDICTKTCYVFKSKVPFFTERIRRNSQVL